MKVQYDAFISYRHCKLDSSIAQRIQYQLEHFKIPPAIKKAYGIKRIERVFRDKEELPLTVDLTADINSALESAKFLIVICTPRTQESPWVLREINMFLKTHSRDRILTVLAEGEPADVVPEILSRQREPLSCDYRMRPALAKKIELPRLASAIIGCRYDELRRRRHQQQLHKLMAASLAAAAVALGLAAYFSYSAAQIKKAYDSALVSQSMYLANSAAEKLAKGDNITAMQLALEALPGENNPRPWVPRAQEVLTDAAGIYDSDPEYRLKQSFSCTDIPLDYCFSTDRSRLICLCRSSSEGCVLNIFDTGDGRLIKSQNLPLSYNSCFYAGGSRLLLREPERLVCIDFISDEELWAKDIISSYRICFSEDREKLLLCSGLQDTALLISSEDGKILSEYHMELPQKLQGPAVPFCISPDGRYAGIEIMGSSAVSDTAAEVQVTFPAVLDMEDGSLCIAETPFYMLTKIFIEQNGDFAVCGKLKNDISTAGRIGSVELLDNIKDRIYLFDGESGAEKWSYTNESYSYSGCADIVPYSFTSENGEQRESFCCYANNVCFFLDRVSGELLYRKAMTEPALDMKVTDSSVKWLLSDGREAVYIPASAPLGLRSGVVPAVSGGYTQEGIFLRRKDSAELMLFEKSESRNYHSLCTLDDTESVPEFFFGRDHIVRLSTVSDGQIYEGISKDSGQAAWEYRPVGSIKLTEPAGLTQDGNYLVLQAQSADSGWDKLVKLKLSDGSTEIFDIPDGMETETVKSSVAGSSFISLRKRWEYKGYSESDGSINSTTSFSILSIDLKEGKSTVLKLPEGENYQNIRADAEGRHVLLHFSQCGQTMAAYADFETGKISTVPGPLDDSGGRPLISISPDGKHILSQVSQGLRLSEADGKLPVILNLDGSRPLSAAFSPDSSEIFVLLDNSVIMKFSSSGEALARTGDMTLGSGLADLRWSFLEGETYLASKGRLYLLDSESCSCFGVIDNFASFDKARDCFYVCRPADSGIELGWLPRLDTGELTAAAVQSLGGSGLSNEQKLFYGLT